MAVIVSNNFVLTESDPTLTPDHPVIGYRNIVTTGNLVADTADVNYPATNLANPATNLKWKAATAAVQYLTITPGNSNLIDYVAIARHNLGSAAIAVSIEGNPGAGYVGLVAPVVLGGDGPALFRFTPQALALGVRIKLAAAAGALASIGVVYAGRLLVLQRRIYVGHTPMPMARVSKITNGMSESGDFLGRIELSRSVQSTVPLSQLDPAWYRANFDPFVAVGKSTPFFFAWRPQSYPAEVGYGWLNNDPMPVPTAPSNLNALSLTVNGVV